MSIKNIPFLCEILVFSFSDNSFCNLLMVEYVAVNSWSYTPFTRYRIQMNLMCFRNVSPFHLHDDHDESDIQSIHT